MTMLRAVSLSKIMSDHKHYKLELTAEALDDFTDIIQYTIQEWGEKQALRYKDKIDNGFQIIIANPEIGLERSDLLPNYRAFSIEHHFVVYRLKENIITVIRILHKKMDAIHHI